MTDLFRESWVLITGASSGLGAELARQLAARHANLVLTARSVERLGAVAEELRTRHGVTVHVIPVDLAEPGGPARLIAEVESLGVAVDHLVNNAGFGSLGRFVRTRLERETEMVRLNCEALVCLTRHFLPGMIERKRGGVIQLSSTAGHQPTPFFSTYGATKAFVLSFAAALSAELEGTGVRMMAFCPGPVPTGFQKAAGLVITDLKKGGLRARLSMMEAPDAVRRCLRAYEAGRSVYVPGLVNRVMTIATKLAPRGLVVNAAARSLSGGGRGRS